MQGRLNEERDFDNKVAAVIILDHTLDIVHDALAGCHFLDSKEAVDKVVCNTCQLIESVDALIRSLDR